MMPHTDRDSWKMNLYLSNCEHVRLKTLSTLYRAIKNFMIARFASISIFINKLGY